MAELTEEEFTRSCAEVCEPVLALVARFVRTARLVVAVCLVGAAIISLANLRSVAAAQTPQATNYLALAERGVAQSAHWRSGSWYCEYLGCTGAYPLLTIWGDVRMFESVDAVQIASPSAADRARVDRFGRASERYWNPYLNGYAPYPGDRYRGVEAWFDDNGWLGIAFVQAYRATGESRYLHDAQRAFNFVATQGWDAAGGGGMWWNTDHPFHSGEALAADTLLGMLLYQIDHQPFQLDEARTFVGWGDSRDIGFHGLYMSGGPGSTVIDYVEGPLIYAQYLLCRATGEHAYCAHAAGQARSMTEIYGVAYRLAPLYDSIFMEWMMAYGKAVGDNHWLEVAQANAAAAVGHATDGQGLWLSSWWGGPITDPQTQPGMFRTMAGTTSLYAWLAYYS
jgi:Glycosyl hydrolase family 76